MPEIKHNPEAKDKIKPEACKRLPVLFYFSG
jgi:hypothetical protein